MAAIPTVGDKDFVAEVLQSDRPVLVDFGADWCGPCRQIAPVIEALDAEYGDKMRFVKVDVDVSPETAAAYRVTGLPTLNVFQGGRVVKQIIGARPKRVLEQELAEFLG